MSKNFTYEPLDVLLNGQSNSNCRDKTCFVENFGKQNVHIILKFESAIESCENMFYKLQDIISADLSRFDVSKVTSMTNMFSGCSQLEYVDFGNINVSSIISSINSMFFNCVRLKYINLRSLKLNPMIDKEHAFEGINSNVKYCIEDIETKNYLLGPNIISICSATCKNNKNIKINLITNECTEECPGNSSEYNNICYNECPNNTYHIFCDVNECDEKAKECLDEIPEGYYLDINNKTYKKCFEKCKFCYGEGNDLNNNCKECINNYTFYTNPMNISNCYQICEYYFYFDEFNNLICTETCPEQYNKLIIAKKQCIDDCKRDNIYIYEYNNTCSDKERSESKENQNGISHEIVNREKTEDIYLASTVIKKRENINNDFNNI